MVAMALRISSLAELIITVAIFPTLDLILSLVAWTLATRTQTVSVMLTLLETAGSRDI